MGKLIVGPWRGSNDDFANDGVRPLWMSQELYEAVCGVSTTPDFDGKPTRWLTGGISAWLQREYAEYYGRPVPTSSTDTQEEIFRRVFSGKSFIRVDTKEDDSA